MDLAEKLEILADSAKYDVACTSSGVDRPGRHGALGSSAAAGICHAFTADGRCVSLLKVLYSNVCSYAASRVYAAGAGGADHRLLPPQLY